MKSDGIGTISLFVVLKQGYLLTDLLKKTIKEELRTQYSPRHVPDTIEQVQDIPYTISGKKMETPVKKILMGEDPSQSMNFASIRNPDSLKGFL